MNSTATMHTNNQDLQLIGEIPKHSLVASNSYYRSLLYTPKTGINPIVQAAQPLLSLITRVKLHPQTLELDQLQQNIMHELKVFESQLMTANYPQQTILLAHFLLSCTIKEIANQQQWELESTDIELFSKEKDPDYSNQNLLLLLKRLLHEPAVYLELLELSYLCLSLGYEDKQITKVVNNIYQCIRQYRGDSKKSLFSTPIPLKKINIQSKGIPWWISITATVILIILTETCFNYALNVTTKPLANRLHTIIQQQASEGLA